MKWKNIKVGDRLKDGSVVTQIHRTHNEECCKVIYDTSREFVCSYSHILLVDVSRLPKKVKKELARTCTFVPLEEDFDIYCSDQLSVNERKIIDDFCNNQPIDIEVEEIEDNTFDFHFDTVKRITIKSRITKSEPQKVDDNTYWLTCSGIKYLMDNYHTPLFCNGMILNDIVPMGKLPCFCISTDTGKYET